MTVREDPAPHGLPRIRRELDQLPLTEEQKNSFAERLAGHAEFIQLYAGKVTAGEQQPDSFLFADKVQAVVDHFEAHGLTATDYLSAVLKRPNILTLKPERITANIQGVVDLFAADGLTTTDYLRAALKQPSLFIQTPWTLSGNITGLVEQFTAEGLTDRQYLAAALKQPSLFTLSPATAANNIRSVVERFQDEGMTVSGYLDAALRLPSLFALSPATVTRHIDAVMDLADRGLFQPPKRRDGCAGPTSSANPVHAKVVDFLVRNPRFLTFADDNYGLREAHQRLTDGPTDGRFLQRARHTVERELMEHLGHNDGRPPVTTADGFVAGATPATEEQAKRFVLRALIHAGFIRGGSMER